MYRNWVNKEIPDHFCEDVPHHVCYWQAKDTKAYRKELEQFFMNTEPGVKMFVMNVEAFSSGKGKKIGEWIAHKFGCQGLIAIDESTTIKTPTAKRTKVLTKIASSFKYRRLLTGSPVTKSPMDLYTQCEFLEPRLLGYDSYYAFRGRYAILRKQKMGIKEFQTIVGFRNLEELTDKIAPFTYRVLKKIVWTCRIKTIPCAMWNDTRTGAHVQRHSERGDGVAGKRRHRDSYAGDDAAFCGSSKYFRDT